MPERADAVYAELRAAWRALLRDARADVSAGESAFADLERAYSEPERYYHNGDHIRAVLKVIAGLRAEAHDPTALRFAAWFHDAVYDPRAKDNEERSADWARRTMSALGVASTCIISVQRLILLTKSHRAEPQDSDGHILLDADLAILGASGAEYRAYAKAIRKEYAWVSDEAYRAGRGLVLRSFLARNRIYHTPKLFAALEGQARRNLEAELHDLERGKDLPA